MENLCKQFELVVTNGRHSFKDIPFLILNEDLQRLFNLAQLGDVDWMSLLGKLGDFGKDITREEIMEDFKNLGSVIAQAGKVTYDSNLQSASKIGEIFKAKPKEIAQMYESFKDHYQTFKDADNIKEMLFAVVGEGNEDAVERLFKPATTTLQAISLPISRNSKGSIIPRDGISISMMWVLRSYVITPHPAMSPMVTSGGMRHGMFMPVGKRGIPIPRFPVIRILL